MMMDDFTDIVVALGAKKGILLAVGVETDHPGLFFVHARREVCLGGRRWQLFLLAHFQ